MALGKEPHVAVVMQGHRLRGGNPDGWIWSQKISKLLGVLARMEREKIESKVRHTDYDLIDLAKSKEYIVRLRPVPKHHGYDPLPAFKWSINQLENIATGNPVDEKVDARTANLIADLAKPEPDGYSKFWINGYSDPIHLDEQFAANALALASQRALVERKFEWFEGSALGTLIGKLLFVDGRNGIQRFAIVPQRGPEVVECSYTEEMEDTLRQNLFRKVAVHGRILYKRDNPHPYEIIVDRIDRVEPASRPDFRKMRGLLAGYDPPRGQLFTVSDE